MKELDQASYLAAWLDDMPDELRERLGFNKQIITGKQTGGRAGVVWLRFDYMHLGKFNAICFRCGLPQPPQYDPTKLLPERAESVRQKSEDIIYIETRLRGVPDFIMMVDEAFNLPDVDKNYILGHDPAKGEDVSGYVVVDLGRPDEVPDVEFRFNKMMGYWLNRLWYNLR